MIRLNLPNVSRDGSLLMPLTLLLLTTGLPHVFAQDDFLGDATGQATATADPSTDNSAEVATMIRQGQQLVQQQRWVEAMPAFRQALELDPANAEGYRGLADCFEGLEQWEQAQQALNALASVAPEEGAAIRDRLAQVMERMGPDSMLDAHDLYRQAISYEPGVPVFRQHLAKSLLRFAEQQRANNFGDGLDSINEASTQLDFAINMDPQTAELYFLRGRARMLLQELDDGIEDLEKAVDLNGSNVEYLGELATGLSRKASITATDPEGETGKIMDGYRQAISLFTRYIDIEAPIRATEGEREEDDFDPPRYDLENVYLLRAEARAALGHELEASESDQLFREVIEDCTAAVALDPENPSLRARSAYNMGIAYRMLNDLSAALEQYTRAIRLSPGGVGPDVMVRRGIVWYRLGDSEMALVDFEQASSAGDPRAYFWKGVVEAERDEYADAVDAYNMALRFQPDYVAAYHNRGLAYMQLGMHRRAARDFQEIIRRKPRDPLAYQRRSVALRHLGLNEAADRSQAQAERLTGG